MTEYEEDEDPESDPDPEFESESDYEYLEKPKWEPEKQNYLDSNNEPNNDPNNDPNNEPNKFDPNQIFDEASRKKFMAQFPLKEQVEILNDELDFLTEALRTEANVLEDFVKSIYEEYVSSSKLCVDYLEKKEKTDDVAQQEILMSHALVQSARYTACQDMLMRLNDICIHYGLKPSGSDPEIGPSIHDDHFPGNI